MNAAIRAATRTAIDRGAEVFGVRCGFSGLIQGDYVRLSARDVGGIIELGGTILESARCPEFLNTEPRMRAREVLERHQLDGLIVIGGNGTQQGAFALSQEGFPVVGVASTIDNDLFGSEISIGADTAVNTALEAIDRLRTTARSHRRVFIIETMGRHSGYLALASGLAGGAEVIVTPECDLSPSEVMELLKEAKRRRKRHAIIVVAEGARNDAMSLSTYLSEAVPELRPRLTVLGHLQRGGRPSAFDRLLATRLAAKAATLLLEGQAGCLVGLRNGEPSATPLSDVAGVTKPMPEELLRLLESMRL